MGIYISKGLSATKHTHTKKLDFRNTSKALTCEKRLSHAEIRTLSFHPVFSFAECVSYNQKNHLWLALLTDSN